MYGDKYWRIQHTGWIQALTLDATEDQVLVFLEEWRAAEIRELAELN